MSRSTRRVPCASANSLKNPWTIARISIDISRKAGRESVMAGYDPSVGSLSSSVHRYIGDGAAVAASSYHSRESSSISRSRSRFKLGYFQTVKQSRQTQTMPNFIGRVCSLLSQHHIRLIVCIYPPSLSPVPAIGPSTPRSRPVSQTLPGGSGSWMTRRRGIGLHLHLIAKVCRNIRDFYKTSTSSHPPSLDLLYAYLHPDGIFLRPA